MAAGPWPPRAVSYPCQVQIQKAKASVPEDRSNIMRLVEPDVTTATALESLGVLADFHIYLTCNMRMYLLVIGINFGSLNRDM